MHVDRDRVIGVDLRGTFLCIRACIGQFLKQGSGSVVNIGSVHTEACLPGAAPYDAAKWAMVGLTKSLAVLWLVAVWDPDALRPQPPSAA